MGKKRVKAIFVIPFYDKDLSQLIDTIDSIKYYVKEGFLIVCINDCINVLNIDYFAKNVASENVINFVPDYRIGWPRNAYGPLFCKIYQGMEYAVKNYNFDFLIKMDTDALVVGSDLHEHVDNFFACHDQEIGLIGSYKIRVDGKKRTRWEWALYLLYFVYFRKELSKQSLIWKVCLPRARKNGYKLGESVLGGAYIFSYKCINNIIKLYPWKIILKDKIYLTKIGEDILFSLLAISSDYKIGDFGRPCDPLVIAHQYLPISKDEIIETEKQIIHSIKKGLDGETEDELRNYFRDLRN